MEATDFLGQPLIFWVQRIIIVGGSSRYNKWVVWGVGVEAIGTYRHPKSKLKGAKWRKAISHHKRLRAPGRPYLLHLLETLKALDSSASTSAVSRFVEMFLEDSGKISDNYLLWSLGDCKGETRRKFQVPDIKLSYKIDMYINTKISPQSKESLDLFSQ